MKSDKPLLISKRDGAVERFSRTKLRNCVARALQASAADARLAEPLSRAVELHMQEWTEPRPPTTDYLFRCVRSVLQQTGLSEAAEALQEHYRARRARRKRCRVVDQLHRESNATAWNKRAIVDTLHKRYGLSIGVARFLAGRVEDQALQLGSRFVSRSLLSELMAHELAAWGLIDSLFDASAATTEDAAAVPPRPRDA